MDQHAQIAQTTRSCSTETHTCASNTKSSAEIQTLFPSSCMHLNWLFKWSCAKNENNGQLLKSTGSRVFCRRHDGQLCVCHL